ncbi:MAG: hypothetical protein OXU37_07060 [Thaumarchaeota archaeon]|nr:hypothetical protein [Nitrososphaerota archaeon]
MDWEMILALTTMFGTAGWLVFKIRVWRREDVERKEAAQKEADERRDAAQKEADERRDAAQKEADERRDAAQKRIDGRLDVLERGQAGIMAELGGIKAALDRFFRTQESDHAMLIELKAEMAGFKSSLDGLYRLHREGMEIHVRQIEALGERIGRLERKVDALEARVDWIARDLAALRSEFEAFREAVAPHAVPAGAAP